MIKIAGTRPAGVYTAGLAQKFVNMRGQIPGRRVVILGSGDIGLIMARRMKLEGCSVIGVFEVQSRCNGLQRNVVQCLEDYGIPLHLSHTVVEIHGRDRVEGVTVAPVNPKNYEPILEKKWRIPCDTLLLSVGLIPEGELARSIGVEQSSSTSGPRVLSNLMTSAAGIFAAGNLVQVHDLADKAAEEGVRAGRAAAVWAKKVSSLASSAADLKSPQVLRLLPGRNVGYVLPELVVLSEGQKEENEENGAWVSLRVKEPVKPALLRIIAEGVSVPLLSSKLEFAVPGHMIHIEVGSETLRKVKMGTARIHVDVDKETLRKEEAKRERERRKAATRKVPRESFRSASIVCVDCPKGCLMDVQLSGAKIQSVVGASCSKGKKYAEQELSDPRRVFSTTLPLEGSDALRVAVCLTRPIPKSVLERACSAIHTLRPLRRDVKIGDIVLRRLLNYEDVDVMVSGPPMS